MYFIWSAAAAAKQLSAMEDDTARKFWHLIFLSVPRLARGEN